MQVKVFSNRRDTPELEAEINSWLKSNSNIQISHVKQSYAYDGKRVFLYTNFNLVHDSIDKSSRFVRLKLREKGRSRGLSTVNAQPMI